MMNFSGSKPGMGLQDHAIPLHAVFTGLHHYIHTNIVGGPFFCHILCSIDFCRCFWGLAVVTNVRGYFIVIWFALIILDVEYLSMCFHHFTPWIWLAETWPCLEFFSDEFTLGPLPRAAVFSCSPFWLLRAYQHCFAALSVILNQLIALYTFILVSKFVCKSLRLILFCKKFICIHFRFHQKWCPMITIFPCLTSPSVIISDFFL